MHFTFFKIAAYLVAWVGPYLIIRACTDRAVKKSMAERKLRAMRALLAPLTWIMGFFASLLGQFYHEAAWWATHPDADGFTEEDMLALGDAPNVTAGWIMIGWLPVMLGLWLTRTRKPGIKVKEPT